MRRLLALFMLVPLTSCTSLASSFGDVMNPQSPILGDGESSPEAPPVAGMVIVEDVGIVLAVDPPGITIGRRRVILSGARGTTQGDVVELTDTTGASIVGSQVVEFETTASVTPTESTPTPEHVE